LDVVDRLLDPLRQPELLDGVVAGTSALVVAGLLGLLIRARTGLPAPLAGLATAAATLVAMDPVRSVPTEVVIGTAAVAAAGLLRDVFRAPLWSTVAAAVPGAVVLTSAPGPTEADFAAAVLLVTVGVGGAAMADLDRRWRITAPGPALVAIAAGGVYSTVPDTEMTLVLLGVSGVVAVGGWPLRLLRLGTGGSFATAAVLAWAIAVDGSSRDGAMIGAASCLGLLAVEPLVALIDRLRRRRTYWSDEDEDDGEEAGPALVALLLVVQAATALYMARVAGLQDDPGAAVVGAAAGFLAAGVVWGYVREAAIELSLRHR
jgi:hypothetical protein